MRRMADVRKARGMMPFGSLQDFTLHLEALWHIQGNIQGKFVSSNVKHSLTLCSYTRQKQAAHTILERNTAATISMVQRSKHGAAGSRHQKSKSEYTEGPHNTTHSAHGTWYPRKASYPFVTGRSHDTSQRYKAQGLAQAPHDPSHPPHYILESSGMTSSSMVQRGRLNASH